MKTWEMIKKLTENPKLKFKSINGDRVQVVDGILRWHDGEIFELNLDGFKIGENTTTSGTMEKYEWEEIDNSVSWQKAFEAGLNGKRIKVKGQFLTYPNYENLHFALNYLSKRPTYFRKLMLDKWYIED